jgi:CubicO group peptidase (beta-lactamase class C family)
MMGRSHHYMKYRLFFVILTAAIVLTAGRKGAAQDELPFEIFGRYLLPLVQDIGMPGVSAAIIQSRPGTLPVIRRYNVGFADLERQIRTRSDTPYPIGGITQAMTGVLHGACIDRFTTTQFDIDRLDMRLFVPSFPVANTSVRQVLSHSTDGRFRYDPQLFSNLTSVVESTRCFNRPFRQSMAIEVLDRMRMRRSVPGMDLDRPEGAAARALFSDADVSRYHDVLTELAVPYRIDVRGRASRSEYPSYGLDAASGMVSTIDDLANFEVELDSNDGHPLSSSTLNQMWSKQAFDFPTPGGGSIRLVTPTGLGWFVTEDSNQPIVWTFGHVPDAASALIVKMPKKGVTVTLIMLANSGGLAKGNDFENANVTSSPFVKVFLRLFI